jgi:hypothetical protein
MDAVTVPRSQKLRQGARKLAVDEKFSHAREDHVIGLPRRVLNRCKNIFLLQEGIISEDFFAG